MKLINKTQNGLSHFLNGEFITLRAGAAAEIPDEVAKIWLNLDGIEEFVEKADKEKLEKENEKLKKELEKLKKPAEAEAKTKSTKKTTKGKIKK